MFDHGELFTPPTERGTILLPGVRGGASWVPEQLTTRKLIAYMFLRSRRQALSPYFLISGFNGRIHRLRLANWHR